MYSQISKDISRVFSRSYNTHQRVLDFVEQPVFLELNKEYLSEIYQNRYRLIKLSIPVSESESLTLNLTDFKVLSDNFILRTSDGDTIHDYKKGVFYRGVIEGKEGFVTISVFEDKIIGLISLDEEGNFIIGKLKDNENEYVVYNDYKIKQPMNFECHTPDTPIENYREVMENNITSRTGECVKVYIEGDYELNQDQGGVAAATNYITGLFAEVTELYANEQIDIEISEIMVWATPDEYSNDDAETALEQFQENNPNFNGDIASLYSIGGGNNGLGGLAWVDVLCTPNWAYAYMGIDGWYNSVPAFSWDVEVVAHEMGHNFGSRHTHACVWNGNNTQIDDCGNQYYFQNGETPEGQACFNSNDPILPSDGTIMSYCHLLPNVGINLTLGFGTQPGNLIRNKYNGANCLTACTGGGNNPVANFTAEEVDICEGDIVYFTDLSSNNPTEWSWSFDGGDPETSDEQNPEVTYYFSGQYDVSLEASNSFGTDPLTLEGFITVYDVAEPGFEYNIINDNEVHFVNISEFANDYFWDFGDGENSSEENPTHIFYEDGTYTVTLYASNSNCSEYQIFSDVVVIVTPVAASIQFEQTDFCKPVTIQFFDVSGSNVTSRQWTFQGGNPATSTATNPTVTYQTAGIYDVTLSVHNSQYSNTIVLNDTVVVGTTPVADFTYQINGSTVSFTNNSAGASSFNWLFGDGSTSTLENPTHTYVTGGTYNATLTSINDCGQNQKIVSLMISAEPFANFSSNPNEGCSPFSTTFNNLSNSTNVNWTFEGGAPATSTDLNPTVSYLSPGSYDVQIIATNNLGSDTLLIENYVTVYSQPSGGFTYNVNGTTVNFTQAVSNVSGFSWDFGDGSQSANTDPVHTYAGDGTYNVVLTYYNSCDTLTQSQQIIIATPPVAGFNYSVQSGCFPLEVQFTNTSSTNSTNFSWNFEGGTPATSTQMNPLVVFNSPGTFDVSLTVSNSAGNNTISELNLINVLNIPEPDFTYTSNELLFNFTYTGDPASTVQWFFGDGASAFGQTTSHVYLASGEYEVTVIASNQCGQNTLVYNLGVSLHPLAQFTYNLNEGCAPIEVQFSNTSSSATSVFWLFEGGIPQFSTADNPIVTYTVEGDYNVTLYAFGNNEGDTLVVEDIIHVNGGPDVDFNYEITNNTVEFTNMSDNDAGDFYWDFGDDYISEDENPVHTYPNVGTYDVTLYASNDCGQHSNSETIQITTIGTIEQPFGTLVLYPNPNNGKFNVEFYALEEGNYDIRVYNATGILIHDGNQNLNSGFNNISFEYQDIPNGLYLMRFIKNGKYQNLMFSKQ